ncbi:MAG: hypothetical protein DMG65_16980 [Candidatus Angelobacter sp. Gp1-AA117]|nr:MAG: hypothetical protein DMG65_16980 [Candidatus Angelobacter sp. Gp1-AA117]
MRTNQRLPFALLSSIAILLLIGCSIHANKDEKGKEKDVDIKTPFGSLSVHKGSGDARDTGLPLYPGARMKNGSDDDENNANVNISSSIFGLKVVAQKFESDDSPDKVLGYYEKQMDKFGKVLTCTGGNANVRFHRHDKDAPVSCDGHSGHDYEKELKVGTENNQHMVAVKPSGKGSEFMLVYVRAYDKNDTI